MFFNSWHSSVKNGRPQFTEILYFSWKLGIYINVMIDTFSYHLLYLLIFKK